MQSKEIEKVSLLVVDTSDKVPSGEYIALACFRKKNRVVVRAMDKYEAKEPHLMFEIMKHAWDNSNGLYRYIDFYCKEPKELKLELEDFSYNVLVRARPMCYFVTADKYPSFSNTKELMSAWRRFTDLVLFAGDIVKYEKYNRKLVIWRRFHQ